MKRLLPCLVCVLLAACAGRQDGKDLPSAAAGETPTISFYFSDSGAAPAPHITPVLVTDAPTLSPFFVTQPALPSPTPLPTRTPYPTLTPSPLPQTPATGLEAYPLVEVYTDTLAAGWSADASWGVRFDLQRTGYAQSGQAAIWAAPQEDFAGLFLAVLPNTPRAYRYDQVAGVRFWISAGDETIYLDQLAATILGSNDYPYWKEGDTSVETNPQDAFFSETRLYYLGFNRELPPRTWLEVIIWLDELPYDPNYTYITGLYIKNDAGLRAAFYVDNVALIQLP